MSANNQPTVDLSDLLTPEQAAQRLGLTVDTVRQYARAPLSRLRAVRVFGRLAFTTAEIERFSGRCKVAGRKKSAS